MGGRACLQRDYQEGLRRARHRDSLPAPHHILGRRQARRGVAAADHEGARGGGRRGASVEAERYGLSKSIPLPRSEEHTSELQSLMRISYAVFCLKKKNETLTIKEFAPVTT